MKSLGNAKYLVLFFLVLTPLGLGALLLMWRLVSLTRGSEEANVWLIGIGSWAATFLVNRQVFHPEFCVKDSKFEAINFSECIFRGPIRIGQQPTF